eukprot:TRINITY_DN1752_c0_g2_i1.p1 TRINITY_DN1752_c0_g2~~TRINITY_DN1752_c0_g2_i1.p1  ORF type:complete len:219 (+),score=72.40 TRINITY_DN1752_c0_g2_i1:656-1312(+)
MQRAEKRRKKLEGELDELEFIQRGKYEASLMVIPEEPSNFYTEMSMNEIDSNVSVKEESKKYPAEFTIAEYLQPNVAVVENGVQTLLTEESIRELLEIREAHSKLLKQNKELKQENERLKNYVGDKGMGWSEVDFGKKELVGLRAQAFEYEQEILKLKGQLKMAKAPGSTSAAKDETQLKEKEQQIVILKQQQVKIMSLVKESNKRFNGLISVLTNVN